MKNVTGIVVEYNPFHYGHQYHIEQAKRLTNADVLIAVMSGNWTQRGEPAVTDKWKRAKTAIQHGVDLVVELPYVYAVQNADYFAKGAIDVLSLCKINHLVFGSECGNIESLKEIADTPFDVNRFKENMDAGFSYPKAYGIWDSKIGPNDILGIAYCKAIGDTPILPHAIERTKPFFSTELEPISSSTAIRQAILNHQDIKIATPMRIRNIPTWEDYYPYLQTLLLTTPSEELEKRLLVSEGIQNHFKKKAKEHSTFSAFLSSCVTRRYTESRVRRTLVHLLTQTNKEDRDQLPSLDYIRILGYNKTGQAYLKTLRKDVNLANKFNQIPEAYRQMEYNATVAYALAYKGQKRINIIEQEIYGLHR